MSEASEQDDDEFKVPKGVACWPDGEAILVLRPQNPPLVMALAHIAKEHGSVDALREATSGPCTFMGYLSKKKAIVDENGENPQPLQKGDIFVSRHEIAEPD
jgi:acetaldehyde dehydrogenase (acetylating)